MPYIKNEQRPDLDKLLQPLIEYLKAQDEREVDGKLNYCMTRMLKGIYAPKYFNYNRAMGVLECVKQEFYRRQIGPYEDKKVAENGDVA